MSADLAKVRALMHAFHAAEAAHAPAPEDLAAFAVTLLGRAVLAETPEARASLQLRSLHTLAEIVHGQMEVSTLLALESIR